MKFTNISLLLSLVCTDAFVPSSYRPVALHHRSTPCPSTQRSVSSVETDIGLSEKTLDTIQKNNVEDPKYDRSKLARGILHIGVGNFHRAHQAAHVCDVLSVDFENNQEWGIVGGSLYSADRSAATSKKRSQLESQDWLQTVVERDGESVRARVIGSMVDFVPVKECNSPIQDEMISPSIKIISLTVTEGGYFQSDGKFDVNNEEIQHDIANIDNPKTVFGMIVKALRYRRENDIAPFAVLSADNLLSNGDVVRDVLVGLAREVDTDLADWIEKEVACPNNMVDRITPKTTSEQKEFVAKEYGFEEQWPIFCEPFTQWVLEDNFPQGRPKLEQLESVTFVEDVKPWEYMKLRILNGGHASLCYPSALLDVDYVHESMEHPSIGPFLDALEHNEIIPTVGPVPNTPLPQYWALTAKRFSNPTIGDTIPRNCFDGASRQPKFIVPVIRDNLKAGRSVDGLALVSALWCRYCQGKTESGKEIEPNDPQWDRLQAAALRAKEDPVEWLNELTEVYGEDVATNPVFVESFSKALRLVQKSGVEAALNEYTSSSDIRTEMDFSDSSTLPL